MAQALKDPTVVRQQQREDWSLLATHWGAPVFGAEVWPPRARLLALAGIRPGQRVLDLACGTGNVETLATIREDALKALGRLFPNGPVQFTNEVLLAVGTKAS